MTGPDYSAFSGLLLMVAGARGAVASTLAVAATALRENPRSILTSLTTAAKFPYIGPPQEVRITGWDRNSMSLGESIAHHDVLPDGLWRRYRSELESIPIRQTPDPVKDLKSQVQRIGEDMDAFQGLYPQHRPIFINLLPAAVRVDLDMCDSVAHIYSQTGVFPDIAYALAAVERGIPVVNFTSNELEIPAVQRFAIESGTPLCGRDGKSGQTYLKVVLASALKARSLFVDGWYSVNILGNADGENLNEPDKAKGKLANKTELLDDLLGYQVGERYNSPTHKVRIDYYPPRGDAKEAWDVIDFLGLFGLPMSLRLNLQGRDSIPPPPWCSISRDGWLPSRWREDRGLSPSLVFSSRSLWEKGARSPFRIS